jgi:hypothetical protein
MTVPFVIERIMPRSLKTALAYWQNSREIDFREECFLCENTGINAGEIFVT